MVKPVYLGLSVLDMRKIVMYEYWYDYIKPKHGGKANLCSTRYKQFHSSHETFMRNFI